MFEREHLKMIRSSDWWAAVKLAHGSSLYTVFHGGNRSICFPPRSVCITYLPPGGKFPFRGASLPLQEAMRIDFYVAAVMKGTARWALMVE